MKVCVKIITLSFIVFDCAHTVAKITICDCPMASVTDLLANFLVLIGDAFASCNLFLAAPTLEHRYGNEQ